MNSGHGGSSSERCVRPTTNSNTLNTFSGRSSGSGSEDSKAAESLAQRADELVKRIEELEDRFVKGEGGGGPSSAQCRAGPQMRRCSSITSRTPRLSRGAHIA